MLEKIRVAGVHMDPQIAMPVHNLGKIFDSIQTAAEKGVNLVVFPECALTGYCFDDLKEAKEYAKPIPGILTELLRKYCSDYNVHIIVGFLELDQSRIYNSAAFVSPNGLIASYRKIHLPYLGIDRFLSKGDQPFGVYPSEIGQIGINICYDAAFPESGRIMMLQEAELIVLPTNWPVGAECNPQFVINTRAFENRVNYMAINRVGTERGTQFIGQSKIIDFQGHTVAEGDSSSEEIIYGDLDLLGAREKHIVNIAKVYELDRLKDRRVEFYGPLVGTEKP